MAAATRTPGASRMVKRDTCLVHRVEWGQEYIPAQDGRQSFWSPPFCPLCEKEFAHEKKFQELVASQVAEITGEIERRISADTERAARISEEATRLMNADVPEILLEWWNRARPQYEQFASDEDWNRHAAEIQEEKREKFFAELEQLKEEVK